jgi:hypothetical protein
LYRYGEASQRAIDAGETYEVCLTNMMHRQRESKKNVATPSSVVAPNAPDPAAGLCTLE